MYFERFLKETDIKAIDKLKPKALQQKNATHLAYYRSLG
jgi:hypothetical protein